MKLKTLKDLDEMSGISIQEFNSLENPEIIVEMFIITLREEAIKWIKEFSEKIRLHSHGDNSDPLYLNCMLCRNMFVNINWIKHFFNIKEEDLK